MFSFLEKAAMTSHFSNDMHTLLNAQDETVKQAIHENNAELLISSFCDNSYLAIETGVTEI